MTSYFFVVRKADFFLCVTKCQLPNPQPPGLSFVRGFVNECFTPSLIYISMMYCKNCLWQNIVCTNQRNVHLLCIFVNSYCRYIYLKHVCISTYSNFYQKYRINPHLCISYVSAIGGFCRTSSLF